MEEMTPRLLAELLTRRGPLEAFDLEWTKTGKPGEEKAVRVATVTFAYVQDLYDAYHVSEPSVIQARPPKLFLSFFIYELVYWILTRYIEFLLWC
jgi:hypothetical protein